MLNKVLNFHISLDFEDTRKLNTVLESLQRYLFNGYKIFDITRRFWWLIIKPAVSIFSDNFHSCRARETLNIFLEIPNEG